MNLILVSFQGYSNIRETLLKIIDAYRSLSTTQWAFTCPKLTIETLEQGVKYVQS